MSETPIEQTIVHELTNLLEKTDLRVVLRAVADESEPDVAIFLVTLQQSSPTLANHASQILVHLPADKQIAVAEQITTMEIVESERVREIHARLIDNIANVTNQTTVLGDGKSNLVKLLGRMKTDDQNRLLDSLAAKQPNLVNDIHERLFTFADLATLNDSAIQTILQVLDPSTIALALHNAPEEVHQKFLDGMSDELTANVEDETNRLTFEQMQIADTARQSIVTLVRNFASKGMISTDREFSE